MLKTGIKGKQEVLVTEDNTAHTYGSGLLEVFATPAMAALIEKTAWMSVNPYMNDGEGTVGTVLNIRHMAATPLGMTVCCESELIKVDGRRLVFHAEVFDSKGKVGEGEHERFVINSEKFMEKAMKRGQE